MTYEELVEQLVDLVEDIRERPPTKEVDEKDPLIGSLGDIYFGVS